ncbi:MAG TPA: TetR/AcrR family transcriptional regulator, partial [Elainellaceae cyanobacterium]
IKSKCWQRQLCVRLVLQEQRMKPDTYHHGDLRQALLTAALEWIDDDGIGSLSLRGIARRVGVSHNAPYRHFEDKTALLAAVSEEGFLSLTYALRATLADAPSHPLRRLETIGVAYVQYAVNHAAHYRVMFGPYQYYDKYPSLTNAANESFMVLVEVIADGQAKNGIRAGNAKELARVAWSLVHGLSMLLIDGQLSVDSDETVRDIASHTTRLLSDGFAIR